MHKTIKHNEELIKHAVEQLLVQGNLNSLSQIFHEDYLAHAGKKINKGHAFIKRFTHQVRTAIPDLEVVQLLFLNQTEDTITWQRSFRGTHKAAIQGIPASNKKVEWYEIVVSRFKGDKILEEWVASDLAGQLMIKLSPKPTT